MFLDAEFFAGVERLDLAGAAVAVAFVPGEEFWAGGDDGDMDMRAAMLTGIVVAGGQEFFADAGVLLIGPDAEETQMKFVPLFLEIHTAEKVATGAGIFKNGGAGILKEFFDAGRIGARAGDQMRLMGPTLVTVFAAVGAVDEGHEGRDISGSGGANGRIHNHPR